VAEGAGMGPGRAALGVSAVAAALTLAACSGSGSGGGGSAGHGGHTGGTVTIASTVAPPTMDLTSNPAAAIDEVLDYNVYQHLVQLDPKGDIVPVLASGYTVSPDGKTYTFTLRSGVKFANGDSLSASDVVFSIKRVIAPTSKYPYAPLFSDVSGVTAQGAGTVVVTLSRADNQFLYNVASNSDGVILDPNSVSSIATATNGTGPYNLKSFVPNYSVTLTANPHYWGGTPNLSEITFRYFSDANAEIAALKSGQVQVIDTLSNPQDAAQFKQNSAFKLVNGPTNGKIQLTINDSAGPLRNLQVRQAISYAINKQAVLQTAGAGYGTVIGSDTVPGDPWYEPSLADTYAYNPAKAKQLLAAAGYPNGFSLVLTLPPYGYAQTAGPLIAAELTQVGIKTRVENIQWPLWLSQVFTNHDFQLTIVDHVEPRDIGNYANCKYYWQFAGCEQVARMLSSAQSATSQAGMVSGYQQVLHLITAQAVNAWLYNPDQVTVAAHNIVGLPGSGLTESFNVQYLSVGGSLPSTAMSQGFVS
jgi:peptide/nickel transport system substrate-binding protein